jgi:hypothetical protein
MSAKTHFHYGSTNMHGHKKQCMHLPLLRITVKTLWKPARQWGFCQQKRLVSRSSLSSDKLQGQTALSHHLFFYYIDLLFCFSLYFFPWRELVLWSIHAVNSNNRIKLLPYLQSSESSPNTYGRPPWLGASAIASAWSYWPNRCPVFQHIINSAVVWLGYVMPRCEMQDRFFWRFLGLSAGTLPRFCFFLYIHRVD